MVLVQLLLAIIGHGERNGDATLKRRFRGAMFATRR